MIVSIGSKNQAKVKAVTDTLHEMGYTASIVPIDAPSNVSNMPFSDEETMQGAINRAQYCLKHSEAELAFGLEGGVMETAFGLFLCNWGALAVRDKDVFLAGGARIKLPEEIAQRLRAGEELGPLMDEYSNRVNVRSNEGAIGIFTNGAVNRSEMFAHIIKQLIGMKEAGSL
ncbi:DUF84 family protein [Bacillus sp. FJAT-50079]|uniref:DUF84 family protein n=1 Tax=Bacillus sp. FJAT-50079 TaxID=2833577 RepID=UPI001BC9D473|nr:DUF84 family protein [Bacillus sp. FJAT-50079]MBS4208636.1 DUF84 family protein [Bacillus sp. FJAT-50079]